MDYSDEILEEAPQRVTKLLTGIGAVPTIRTLLFQAGMTDADIAEGRKLLLACLAAPADAAPQADTADAVAQRAAVAELDEWDEPNFARYAAALRRHHPKVGDYVFNKLSASTGVAAVQGVATFLGRLDVLEHHKDPGRQDAKTEKEDDKAIALLAKRGLDAKERARLDALVKVALGPTSPLPVTPASKQNVGDARKKALSELRGWFDEWSTAARAVVKKKNYLIRLGLAARKSPVRKAKPTADKEAPK